MNPQQREILRRFVKDFDRQQIQVLSSGLGLSGSAAHRSGPQRWLATRSTVRGGPELVGSTRDQAAAAQAPAEQAANSSDALLAKAEGLALASQLPVAGAPQLSQSPQLHQNPRASPRRTGRGGRLLGRGLQWLLQRLLITLVDIAFLGLCCGLALLLLLALQPAQAQAQLQWLHFLYSRLLLGMDLAELALLSAAGYGCYYLGFRLLLSASAGELLLGQQRRPRPSKVGRKKPQP